MKLAPCCLCPLSCPDRRLLALRSDPKQVTNVHSVKSVGSTGLALLGKGNSKELELEAADPTTRDVWVSRSGTGGGSRFKGVRDKKDRAGAMRRGNRCR